MTEPEPLGVGDAVLVDGCGARVARFSPSDQVGLVLDLQGRLNGLAIRDTHRYLLTAGQAAELIAELIVAGNEAAVRGSDIRLGSTFADELEAAVALEQERRGLGK
jgi:hypothetical protein